MTIPFIFSDLKVFIKKLYIYKSLIPMVEFNCKNTTGLLQVDYARIQLA